MREKINRLAGGQAGGKEPLLSVLPAEIITGVRRGERGRVQLSADSGNSLPLKGLAYSDHPRVSVSRRSFGGMKNRITLEADASGLSEGDEISGTLSLITNGGEKAVPFTFKVTENAAERTLRELTDAGAFFRVALKDPEAAQKIFEYSKFREASFLSEPSVRALYEAFRQGPDRMSAMREFLKSQGYDLPENRKEEETREMKSEGGSDSKAADRKTEAAADRSGIYFTEYLKCRISAWIDGGQDESLKVKLLAAAEALQEHAGGPRTPDATLSALLLAEAHLYAGHTEQAEEIVAASSKKAIASREKALFSYLLLETLRALLPGGEIRRDGTSRLVKKFLIDNGNDPLLPLFLSLQDPREKDPVRRLIFLQDQYEAGSRNSFLFAELAAIYEQHPELIKSFDDLTLHALRFSLRYGKPGEETAAAYAKAASQVKNFPQGAEEQLKGLYRRCPTKKLLTAVCACLIRNDDRTDEAHVWYRRAFEYGAQVTGLYESLASSLPEEGEDPLPREVFLYFAYDNRLDDEGKAKLYENLCRFRTAVPNGVSLFEEYRPQVEAFALQQLLSGNVNRRLAVLYEEILSPDMVDKRLAGALPKILLSREIAAEDRRFRNVLVVYPELAAPEAFPLSGGRACVPVYSEEARFLFEDTYGNRYAAPEDVSLPVLCLPGLIEACRKELPDQPALLVEGLSRILRKAEQGQTLSAPEQKTLLLTERTLHLSGICRQRLVSALIESGNLELVPGENDILKLPEKDQVRCMQLLLKEGRKQEALRLFKTLKPLRPDAQLLRGMAAAAAEEPDPEDSVKVRISLRAFDAGLAERAVLSYLCGAAGGCTKDLLRLLDAARRYKADDRGLPERLAVQMLFSGETEELDRVFREMADAGSVNELLSRAYVTERCSRWLSGGPEPLPEVFRYLQILAERRGTGVFPTLYSIALTKHYAMQDSLTPSEQKTAGEILGGMLDGHLSFPYYKNLARLLSDPPEIREPALMEFVGEPGKAYILRTRILPEEPEFREQPFLPAFGNLYTAGTELFTGECWEYEVKEAESGEIAASGRSEGGDLKGTAGSGRFFCLNRMSEAAAKRDEERLKKEIRSYAKMSASLAELFRPAGHEISGDR